MTITGDPDRLEEYSSITLPTLPPAHGEAIAYGSLITALHNAPSSVSLFTANYSAWIEGELDVVGGIDRRPAAFGFALRQLDSFVPDNPRDRTYLRTNDLELFNALVNARLARPDESDALLYNDALNALTGTPDQLAGQLAAVVSQINDSMNGDDVGDMQSRLVQLLDSLEQGNAYRIPPLTDLERVKEAWVLLNGSGASNIVPSALVEQLQDLTGLLGRRRFDPAFTSAFYEALGPEFTSLLPRAISLASWSDNQRTSGEPTFDIQNALVNVGSALGAASPNLSDAWRDDLFRRAVTDGTVDDSFPLLFTFGQFSKAFATSEGQLGLDILQGTVTVDRGVGSPGYPNFDELATNWEDRGTILIDSAARTPEAANALLRDQQDVAWLTDDKFGRDGRHPPDWNVIAPSIRNLIVSGTVYDAATEPELAREAATNVINTSIAAGPGRASEALAPAYGDMVVQYLPDFARSPGADLPAESRGDYISIGALQAAQFTSLAMQDANSKADILAMRDVLDMQTAVVGLESQTPLYPPWAQRVANIDGIVLSGLNGQVFVNARQQDADAARFNENLDLFQGIALDVIGLGKFPGSGIVDKAIGIGFDQLKTSVLYQDTNNASAAGYTTNVAAFSAFDRERLVVAEGQLIAAVRVEQSGGTLTADQSAFIDYAEQMLGQPYVDALRAAANGVTATPVPVTQRQLQEWAGSSPIDQGFTDASNYTDGILPRDGTSLWQH